jgi:hypothetical protein
MTMHISNGEPATGFQISRAGSYLLRDYSHDDPAALTELRGLLEQLITGPNKFLIPGSLNRLVIQWHADVHRAIQASAGPPESGPQPGQA